MCQCTRLPSRSRPSQNPVQRSPTHFAASEREINQNICQNGVAIAGCTNQDTTCYTTDKLLTLKNVEADMEKMKIKK
jgi:hypothetical protein